MGVDYKNEERMLRLKYELKTNLEKLIHKNIMEEVRTKRNKPIIVEQKGRFFIKDEPTKRRETRRGIK